METLHDIGEAIAARRRALGLKQGFVAASAGVTQEFLSRLERGRLCECGIRKLLAILAVLELEIQFVEKGMSGLLDELRKERSGGEKI